MEHDIIQRHSATTIKNMGLNSYSQVISAFRAQGDLTENQLNILPVLQNAFGISRERHTAEVKRALYDEQLSDIATSINPASSTKNWEIEANYACPTVVHRPPKTQYVELAEQVLQTTPPTTIIQYPQVVKSAKLNNDLQQILNNEVKEDGIQNATQYQQQSNNTMKPNLNNTDHKNSKVVRLVRAKQATKRKSSLETLIEVVQKELLRVNEQSNISSPTKLQTSISTPHRPIISSILPSSHPNSLTSQTQSFKIARRRGFESFHFPKKSFTLQPRIRSFNDDDNNNRNDINQTIDDQPSGPENIEEIVRDTVDKLVALTILNTAPFVVNMLTAVPNNDSSTNTELKRVTNTLSSINTSSIKSSSTIPKSDYYRNDLALLSSTASDIRSSIQQTSPLKQQQIHHPQLIIQPTATTNPISTIQGATTQTLFVAPRILNFQTVVPKPTTNIQIGNTKIILVSPSNITQHLPHSTTPIQPPTTTNVQQQNLVNNSPVKLVKFATTTNTNHHNNNNNSNSHSITTRPTINTTQTSTLTLPKNVQIVIPSQTSSAIQLSRTLSDESNKSLPTTTTTTATFRPVTLTACTGDPIPQATQEVTISASPMSSPPLKTNVSDHQQQSSIATIMDNTSPTPTVQQHPLTNVTTIRTSPTHDDMIKSVTVNFQPKTQQQIARPASTHGPMIYRMTSVNPNVPVFRVRATGTPPSTTVINKSIKTETKPISVAAATNVCYEPKPTHTTSTTGGSVSVLACFKTTKKRNKERAIMPRPSTTDSNDTPQEFQQRLNTIVNTNSSLVLNSDTNNSNSSSDYRQHSPSTPTRLAQQTSLSSTCSDDNISNMFSSSMNEQNNDTTSSSNSIPISRYNSAPLNNNSMRTITTPNISPIMSPMHTLNSTPKFSMDDKYIESINDPSNKSVDDETSMEHKESDNEPIVTNSEINKRPVDDVTSDDESWTIAAENILRDVLLQDNFQLLDANHQEDLTSKFNLIQNNLVNRVYAFKDELYNSILDIKRNLFNNDLAKMTEDNLEKVFHYFESEFGKICDQSNEHKRLRRE